MFTRIYLFFLICIAIWTYAGTLLFLWFFRNGASVTTIALYFLAMYATAAVILVGLRGRTLSTRRSLVIGLIADAVGYLIALTVTHPVGVVLVGVAFGFNIVFFWTAYNVSHFSATREEHRGLKSGIYFLFMPIFGVVLAPLAGHVAETYGFPLLIASGGVLVLLPLLLIPTLPNYRVVFDLAALRSTRLAPLIFLQGALEAVNFAAIALVTLSFIDTPVATGRFFGLLAAFAGVATLFNTFVSDRLRHRKTFFYASVSLYVASVVLFVVSRNFGTWRVVAGANNFLITLVGAFWVTLVLDHLGGVGVERAMAARELWANLGRSLTLIVAIVSYLLFRSFTAAFAFVALLGVAYIVLAHRQRVYLQESVSETVR